MIIQLMKQLFETHNYKIFLRNIVYSPEGKRGLQVQMAKAMGCQAAYLSQVLRGKAELTEDHSVRLAGFLKLNGLATEYFLLLVRLSRASTPELREYLEGKRKQLLQESGETQSRVSSKKMKVSEEALQKYFSSWIPSTVHMATSSPNFQSAEAIAIRLRLPVAQVESVLSFLEEIAVVERSEKRWRFASAPLHFPKESPVNIWHQSSRRNQALRAIEENDPQDLHFSSIFTISPKTFKALKADMLDYIEQSHKKIQASGTDELYSICLDLFRVV